MAYGRRQPQWPPAGWGFQPYRQPLAARAARAAAAGAGRVMAAGGKRAVARWRPGMPLLVAFGAHILVSATRSVVLAMRLAHAGSHTWTVDGVLLVAAVSVLTPAWWVALGWSAPWLRKRSRRWPAARLAHLGVGSLLLAAYLPVSVWWLPPWRTLGTPWLPVAVVSSLLALAVWAWGYYGFYRIREVEQDPEPVEEYGPAEVWADEVGAAGKLLPGSVLTGVRDIEAPV